jgi:hypothetical protein
MPNLNGKGPFGGGPMTGRGSGRYGKRPSEQIKKSQDQSIRGELSTPDRFRDSDKIEMYGSKERRRFWNRNNS